MDLEEYSSRQRRISASIVDAVLELLRPFQMSSVSESQWEALVRVIFDQIDKSRTESAHLARDFFDSQWLAHRSGNPPDIDLPPYFERYTRELLQPVKSKFQQENAPQSALSDIAELAMKDTEQAGRQSILRPVEDSPEVIGYARVLTGRENCGFCVMLASRGAQPKGLYRSEESALYKSSKAKTFRGNTREKFHKGCDCKVVPVFDLENYPGREQQQELARLWRDVTKGYSGKDALNALRRYLYENGVEPAKLQQVTAA
ncbi:VG15 protein [Actinopolyspora erythraea]|uniref:VG15 protein n=1 Tax=Actinopolyspora erythraea TaxID=414996 RepID=UPI001186381A|nr:hypothetical protein [Actinopolyspora erythraea]